MPLSVQKSKKRLEVSGSLPSGSREIVLQIHSSRNGVISKFSDVAPAAKTTGILSPEIDNSRMEKDIWFPVVDIAIDVGAEGILLFEPNPDEGNAEFSINGRTHQVMYPVMDEAIVPAVQLEYWENSVFIDGASSPLTGFFLRWRFESAETDFSCELELLSEQWSGSVELSVVLEDSTTFEVGSVSVADETTAPARTHPGTGLEHGRVVSSLNATMDCIQRRVNVTPWSETAGGLYLFYDLDAKLYRNPLWTWTWGPEVKLILDALNRPELCGDMASDWLRTARELGETSLRFQVRDEADPVDRLFMARWDPSTQYPFGIGGHVSPPDGLFLMGWAWIPLYEATGDARYLDASMEQALAVGRLLEDWSIVPQDYLIHSAEWKAWVVDEASFGMEGLAELFRVTQDDRFRAIGRQYMEGILAKFDREDGLWERFYFIDKDETVPVEGHTRGLAWAIEGLMAANRLLPGEGYLARAEQLAKHFVDEQHESGYWSFLFQKSAEEVGIAEKGTAAWCYLLYRLHAETGEHKYLVTARKALQWLIDNQYTGPDPDAVGSVIGCSPHSGVVYRNWFNLSCTYTSGFFGLAALEELKRAEA